MITLTIAVLILSACIAFIAYQLRTLWREHTKMMTGLSYLIDQASASRYITVGGYLVEVERLSLGYRGRLADLEAIKFHADTMAGLRREAEKAIHSALEQSAMRESSPLRGLDA